MVRFPYPRLAYLFDALQSETLPQDELAKRLAVSTRTVRADITALNDILEKYGARFVHSRGAGYRLQVDDAKLFNALQLQERRKHVTPRSAQERVHALLVRFLTSAFSLKLEDLADEWFVSRGTLQNDMAEVRERLAGYQLTIETKPRYGMKLFGAEMAIRACLTDLLFQLDQEDAENPLLNNDILLQPQVATFAGLLHPLLSQYNVRLTDKGEQYLIFYCAVALKRISDGYPLPEFDVEDGDEAVRKASTWLAGELSKAAGKEVSAAEEAYLRVNIAARRVQEVRPTEINADDEEALVDYILSYINTHYNYNLQGDKQLRADLLTHIKTMITPGEIPD
ncbi:Probable licABCH operon regulator [Serratia rubidaea]|uniref:Probable licABCH operon regulator n=1 Tax=Serratia rubidaea TaxID=61652 RepID=A0A4U9HTF7_SERRU|nr:Probable licABCH operon regulator [Serratia rubidaea]